MVVAKPVNMWRVRDLRRQQARQRDNEEIASLQGYIYICICACRIYIYIYS